MSRTYNLLIAGVGGQGVITASQLVARAAIASGLDVRLYGSYGMAQRGGSVSAHLRIGEHVLGARIEKGELHLLVGMEIMEAARWVPLLSGEGRLVVNGVLIPPVGRPVKDHGPRLAELLRSLPGAVLLDAGGLAGNARGRGLNAVMLGAASAVKGFPVGVERLESALREDFGKNAGPQLKAFRRGREAMR